LRFKPHLLFPRLDRLVTDPRLLDPVEDLIGGDILVWASAFFIKDAGDPGFVSWHQDSATYGLEGGDLVTAWLAVTPATTANAAMRFIPGSHRDGPRRHVDIADPTNMLSRGETIPDANEEAAVDVVLAPGEMSLHHIDLIHASGPNRSDQPRIGYAIRYCAPSMRPIVGAASARLVRGRDRCGHFELEPAPRDEHDAVTRAAHARALDLRERSVFATLDA
jgi:ectoine hydroxylase-related dioxygenase (phytanoyl-CoA dioxygenase family)